MIERIFRLKRLHLIDQTEGRLQNSSNREEIRELNYFLALNEIVYELENEIEHLKTVTNKKSLTKRIQSAIFEYDQEISEYLKDSKYLNV